MHWYLIFKAKIHDDVKTQGVHVHTIIIQNVQCNEVTNRYECTETYQNVTKICKLQTKKNHNVKTQETEQESKHMFIPM